MGLQVWLPLNGDVKNQGLMDTSPQALGNGTWENGKIGKCYNGGGNGYVFINTPIAINGPFSIAFWLKVNSFNAAWGRVFGFTKSTNEYLGMCYSNTNSIGFHICDDIDGTKTSICDSYKYIPVLGEWAHMAIVFDGETTIKWYKDGVLHATQPISRAFSGDIYTKLGICANASGANKADCSVNDFRIYDHALSSREVKEISKGLVLHYPLAMPGQENIIANTSHEIVCTYPASGTKDYYSVKTKSVPNETQYTLSFEARSTVDGDHLRTHFYNPNTTTKCESSQGIINTFSDGNMDFTLTTEWRRYWVVYTQTETTAIKSVICPRLCSPASYPSSKSGTGTVYVRNQKLERGSRPTSWIPNPADAEYSALGFDDGIEYDVSGFGNNGTKIGTLTYDADTPRYETSTVLDGTYITLAGVTNQAIPQFSICGWVNLLTGYNTNYGCHLINFSKTYCRICISKDGAAVRLLLTDGTTNYSASSAMSASSLSANVWNHYAVTFDNGSIKIYINGELDASRTVTITSISPGTPWTIGNHGTTEIPKAKVSDVRFYMTCLNESDVRELYNTSMSLSNNGVLFGYEFIE